MSVTLESLRKRREELMRSLESSQRQLQDLEQTRQMLAAQIFEIRGRIQEIDQLIIELSSERESEKKEDVVSGANLSESI